MNHKLFPVSTIASIKHNIDHKEGELMENIELTHNSENDCKHFPYNLAGINSFFYFFSWKLGFCKKENLLFSCICCGSEISIPRGYYQPFIKVMYCVISALLTWACVFFSIGWEVDVPLKIVWMTLLGIAVHSLGMRLLDSIVFAAVCTWGTWQSVAQKDRNNSIVEYREKAHYRHDQKDKTRMIQLGFFISLVLIANQTLLILVPVEAICSMISCYKNKRSNVVCICVLILALSLVLLFVTFQNDQMSTLNIFREVASFFALLLLNIYCY